MFSCEGCKSRVKERAAGGQDLDSRGCGWRGETQPALPTPARALSDHSIALNMCNSGFWHVHRTVQPLSHSKTFSSLKARLCPVSSQSHYLPCSAPGSHRSTSCMYGLPALDSSRTVHVVIQCVAFSDGLLSFVILF